jgi:hypothetical protein
MPGRSSTPVLSPSRNTPPGTQVIPAGAAPEHDTRAAAGQSFGAGRRSGVSGRVGSGVREDESGPQLDRDVGSQATPKQCAGRCSQTRATPSPAGSVATRSISELPLGRPCAPTYDER